MVEESMDDEGNADRALVVEVEIWDCHLVTVEVFRLCTIAMVGAGMGGLVWIGIEATEIHSALVIRRVPHTDWPYVAEDVAAMGAEVASERNRRTNAEAKRRK